MPKTQYNTPWFQAGFKCILEQRERRKFKIKGIL
jgi:hypothetical protein